MGVTLVAIHQGIRAQAPRQRLTGEEFTAMTVQPTMQRRHINVGIGGQKKARSAAALPPAFSNSRSCQ